MKLRNKFFILNLLNILIVGLLFLCCNRIENETDPAKIILGKWECIQYGNWPVMYDVPDAGGYMEFKRDSILTEVAFNPYEEYNKRYCIDSLLHEDVYDSVDDKWIINFFTFKYEFFDKNRKMRLDFAKGVAEFKTAIYKRIK